MSLLPEPQKTSLKALYALSATATFVGLIVFTFGIFHALAIRNFMRHGVKTQATVISKQFVKSGRYYQRKMMVFFSCSLLAAFNQPT